MDNSELIKQIEISTGQKAPLAIYSYQWFRVIWTSDPEKGLVLKWQGANQRFETMDERDRRSPLPREEYYYDWREVND